MERLSEWSNDLMRMIYPKVCEVCGYSLTKGEDIMCLHCSLDLPRANMHNEQFNIIHQRLAGHAPIDKAAGYFYYYKDSSYSNLILNAKYHNRPIIARLLASRYAQEISNSGFFNDIDIILPVPMHWIKRMRRGYNQSEAIAQGIKKVTGIEIGKNLIAKRGHSTQTRKSSYARWKNAQNIYTVTAPEQLESKHVLVVDDVVTTGATLLACCEAIHKVSPTTTISVLTLAVTHLS